MCFAYCHIAYISFGSCKDCAKEQLLSPPSPPSSHFTHTPLPVYYTFALWASGHGFSFLSRPLFQSWFHKRGCGFLAAMLVNSISKGLLLLQRGLIMLSFSETFFLKTTRPIDHSSKMYQPFVYQIISLLCVNWIWLLFYYRKTYTLISN